MNQNLTIFKDPETLADKVSDWLVELIANSTGNRFDLAISGGSTPKLLFRVLASKYPDSILWQKTHFWWVDERMVLPEEPESNYGVARELLFSKIRIPDRNIHRMRGEQDPCQEAEYYAQQIRDELDSYSGWPRFDLLLLGVGEDGHTASIFPDRMELLLSGSICEVAHHPVTGQSRITLTGSVINRAAKICFLVTGAGKAERLSEIFFGTEKASLLPAAYIKPVQGELSWFTDESAARLLP